MFTAGTLHQLPLVALLCQRITQVFGVNFKAVYEKVYGKDLQSLEIVWYIF